MFLVDRQGVLGRGGQPHQHSGAEVERPVVPAAAGNGLNRETGPLGELLFDKTTHLRLGDGDALRHGTKIGRVTQLTSCQANTEMSPM